MRNFVARWQRFGWLGTAFGILMLIIGIPSFFQDIETWGHWLSEPAWLRWLRWLPLAWMADQGAWWGFVVGGLLIIFLSNLPGLLRLLGVHLGFVAPARPMVAATAEAVATAVRAGPFTGPQITEPVPVPPEAEKMTYDQPDAPEQSPNEENTREEDEPQAFSPQGYKQRFGLLWKVRYVHRRYVGVFASLNSIMNAPPLTKVDGPFCPADGTVLRYKDRLGDRYIMDEDDIGGSGGTVYFPQCGMNTRPDPDYDGARELSIYRDAVHKEFSE